MKKRVLTFLLAGVLASAGALAGCAQKDTKPAQEPAAEKEVAAETKEEEVKAEETVEETVAEAEPVEVREIHVATGGHTKPWTFVDENDNLVGYDIEIVEEVFSRLPQYELVFDVVEFSSIFTGLDAGYYQMGANNIALTEERQAKYLYSVPKVKSEEILLSSTIDFEKDSYTLDEVTQWVYTLEPGNMHTTEAEKYNEAHPDNPIEINYTEETVPVILQNVQDGKYELFSTAKAMYFGAYQKEFGFDLNYATLDYGRGQAYAYFIAAKGEEQLIEDFNTVLTELIKDGTVAAISEKYIGEDLVPYEAFE